MYAIRSYYGTFAGDIALSEPGEYTLDLFAYDPTNGNTGVRRIRLQVE